VLGVTGASVKQEQRLQASNYDSRKKQYPLTEHNRIDVLASLPHITLDISDCHSADSDAVKEYSSNTYRLHFVHALTMKAV